MNFVAIEEHVVSLEGHRLDEIGSAGVDGILDV
jgi:hypothetical protein